MRENPVPCQRCGIRKQGTRIDVVSWTWRDDALCNRHANQAAQVPQQRITATKNEEKK